MKKAMIFILVLVATLGTLIVCNRRIKTFFGSKSEAAAMRQDDLEIINDTKDSVSSSYEKSLNKMSVVAKPSEVLPGGKGLMMLHVPHKKGFYEIRYLFPRPENKPSHIAVSQIIGAVDEQKSAVEGKVLVAHGAIDDIDISYEEILDEEE